jgi:hypothetical protein
VREPLLHFLLIGLALFLWYGRVAPAGTDPSRIVVTQAQVDVLARCRRCIARTPRAAA